MGTTKQIGQGEEEEENNQLKWRSHQTPCKGRRSARTTWEGGALGGEGGRKEPATSNIAGASSWWGSSIQCGGIPRMMAGCGTPFQTTSRRGVDLLSFFHITRWDTFPNNIKEGSRPVVILPHHQGGAQNSQKSWKQRSDQDGGSGGHLLGQGREQVREKAT